MHPHDTRAGHSATRSLAGALVWLRRDLRLEDNAALYHALRSARRVWCAFVFDREILDPLPRADRRVAFIHASLLELDEALARLGQARGDSGVGLIVRHGRAREVLPALAAQLGVQAVYASHDDDPYALERDGRVRGALAGEGIALHTMKDHVVFERDEVMTGGGTPYGVFTPYRAAWLKRLEPFFVKPYPVLRHADALAPVPPAVGHGVPALETIGFEPGSLASLRLPVGPTGGQMLLQEFLHDRVDAYDRSRDFPAIKGPSYLGVHLRFGTVSIRQLAGEAWRRSQAGSEGARVWLSELVWRDFYHQILHHHPHVVGHSFRPAYDRIAWAHGKTAEAHFQAWCEGRTGYPIVDAAMHQLLQTGYMHNRLRMITASFLTKDLGIDWRRGEAFFALHLNDYDLAANNGGWQWAASTGCDAQPYFRIFNPVSQSRKFDPSGKFIRRYLPQLAGLGDAAIHAPWEAPPLELQAAGVELGRDYPLPVVDHAQAREATLRRFAVVRDTAG